MKRNILEIYAMVTCLLASFYGLAIASFCVSDTLFLVHPEWEMVSDNDKQYASNDAFCEANFQSCKSSFDATSMTVFRNARSDSNNEDTKKMLQEQEDRWAKQDAEQQAKYSPEAITKKRLDAFGVEKMLRHERTVMTLVHNIIQLFIISVFFFIHWKIGRKARAVTPVGSNA